MREDDVPVRHWPDEVLQMIFCRLPYPALLKVKGISKAWKAIFSNAFLLVTPAGHSFRSDVLSVSSRWPEFCPVFGKKDDFWGFMQSSQKWQHIVTHVSLIDFDTQFRMSLFSGPYMCSVGSRDEPHLSVVVMNILTGRHKVLPVISGVESDPQFKLLHFQEPEFIRLELPITKEEYPHPYDFAFVADSHGYSVYLLFEFVCYGEQGQDLRGTVMYLYRSTTDTWERFWTEGHRDSTNSMNEIYTGSTAYLEGNLYSMCVEPVHVWKYQIQEGMWIQGLQSKELVEGKLAAWGVVACGSMLMAVTLSKEERQNPVACVFELDRETLESRQVSSSTVVARRRHYRIVSDTDFIYICPEYFRRDERLGYGNLMSVYRVIDQTWSEIELPAVPNDLSFLFCFLLPGAFRPGLRPFSLP